MALRTKEIAVVYIQEAFIELFVEGAFGVLTRLSFCRNKHTHCFWTSYLHCVTILQIKLNQRRQHTFKIYYHALHHYV